MNSVRSHNLSLKYQRFDPEGCKEIEIRNVEFATKTQFLYVLFYTVQHKLTHLIPKFKSEAEWFSDSV